MDPGSKQVKSSSLRRYLSKDLPEILNAAFKGKADSLRSLMSRGCADVSSVDVYGKTALHIAASQGHFDCLQLLCKGCKKEALNCSDCFGYTALHYAVQGANTYCAKVLLEAGCNPNAAQHSQYTPLHLAALYGYPELVALLCQHGANVHARSSAQETPLLMASRSGIRIRERMKVHYTTLALLLKFGSNVNARDREGMTSLHYVAMQCEGKECAVLLYSAGASIRYRNHNNLTAVDVARCPEVERFLSQLERAPLRLEQLCLLAVRKSLGTDLKKRAERLSLPKPLKDKLLFKSLPKLV